MKKWWTLYRGKLEQRTLFTDMRYKQELEFPSEGRVAYFVDGHRDVRVVFAEGEQVFHEQGIDIGRYKADLDARRDIARHC